MEKLKRKRENKGDKAMKYLGEKFLILAVVLGLFTVMASGSSVKSDIKTLVEQRTDIMNGYYCGHITYREAINQISDVETGRLLEEDLLAMREFFQTDIEEINQYKISKIEITGMDETLICAVVTIIWQLNGTGGKESFEKVYSVIIEKKDKSYKLVQFF